jgi:hypothetical protein
MKRITEVDETPVDVAIVWPFVMAAEPLLLEAAKSKLPEMVTEDCAEAAETTARAARAHVLTIVKMPRKGKSTEGPLAALDAVGLYSYSCTSESQNYWVLFNSVFSKVSFLKTIGEELSYDYCEILSTTYCCSLTLYK